MNPTQAQLAPILAALVRALGRRAPTTKRPSTKTAQAFFAEGQLPGDAMSVTVEDLGPLARPLSAAAAQALHAASTPAHHGRRDKTALDKRVRDTGELHADRLFLQWAQGAFDALQAQVAQGLGLQHLQARLHNLLVYGPGQFFKPHQDTEKLPGMVATLVLVVPSPHIGGELIVRHGSEQARFASQHLNADTIRWCAFYADCRHEVLPVAEGWRVVLSFDLVLPTQSVPHSAAPAPVLLKAMREHFLPAAGPTMQAWVFLLDHEYSERGLHWPLLKGADRQRVAALRAAAEALGLTVHLALAEIHEEWTAIEGPGPRQRGRGHWQDIADPQPDELLNRDIVLDHWVDAQGRTLRREALPVAEHDTASFSETDASFLVNQEYEGYMGNYGETLDHWYRRAALVIQTPQAEQASRFVSDFDAALADALALARQGRGEELATRLGAAAKAIDAQRQRRGHSVFEAFSTLAAALPDAGQARALMEGFDWVHLQAADARALAQLSAHHGEAWVGDLIDAWAQPAHRWQRTAWNLNEQRGTATVAARPPWPQRLSQVLELGLVSGLGPNLSDRLVVRSLQALAAADTDLLALSPASRAASLTARQQALCELATALPFGPKWVESVELLVRHVQAHPDLYPLKRLRPLLEALPERPPTAAQDLRKAVLAALRLALATPERGANDHTLDDIEWVCRCADCSAVIRWAESAQAQALTLAMPEARRNHVQERLSAAAAPVVCNTLRQGSPHKLVIDKAPGWHDKQRALRQTWKSDLAMLEGN